MLDLYVEYGLLVGSDRELKGRDAIRHHENRRDREPPGVRNRLLCGNAIITIDGVESVDGVAQAACTGLRD